MTLHAHEPRRTPLALAAGNLTKPDPHVFGTPAAHEAPPADLAPDLDEAESFLRTLAGEEGCTFQTFADDKAKGGNLARILHAAGADPLAEGRAATLTSLNASGAGVFVVVNATDGRGRKAENITSVRALFADFDDANPQRNFEALGLAPSIIVESSPGKHHAYWLTDPAAPWPPAQFEEAQRRIAAAFGTDPKVHDLPRVMRLPGFFHRKAAPFLVRTVRATGQRYTAAELRAWLDSLAQAPLAGLHRGEAPAVPRNGATGLPAALPRRPDTYADAGLQKGLGTVMTAPEGERNATLNREAFGLYGLHRAGRIADPTEPLRAVALAAGLGEAETARTLQSAREAAQPRYAEPRVQGSHATELRALAQAGEGAEDLALPPPFVIVPIDDLNDAELPPQEWAWEGYIPCGEVTLLAAHGGAGKSYLSLMLAACTALGLPLFGVPTTARPVVFFSGEDPAATARRRLQLVLGALGIDASNLAGRLVVVDATAGDPALMRRADPRTPELIGTPTLAELRALLTAQPVNEPGPLLIADNASDTFEGNENARAEVRRFVRELAGLVRPRNGAVLLLAHVDKNTARGFGGGEGYSGSTAWHNSARSRLFLERDAGAGALTLKHEKSTHGAGLREPLRLVWPAGSVPTLDAPLSGVVGLIDAGNNIRTLLRLIHEFSERGEHVSTATTSRTHAGRLLRGQPGFPKRMTDTEVFDALRDAHRRGWLAPATVRGANRHGREVWEVTPKGRAKAEIAPTAPTAPTSEVSAPDAPEVGCADCADFGAGGMGGMARAESAREVDAEQAG